MLKKTTVENADEQEGTSGNSFGGYLILQTIIINNINNYERNNRH